MNQKYILAIIIILLAAICGFIWFQMDNTATAPTDNQPTTQNQQQENPIIDIQLEPVAKTFEVIYTDAGYSPSTLTIKAGDTVMFKNQSSGNMWIASGMHPTHMVYNGTDLQSHCPDAENDDFDQCANGAPQTSWNFTFTKAGTWGYHNHTNSPKFGKIIVE